MERVGDVNGAALAADVFSKNIFNLNNTLKRRRAPVSVYVRMYVSLFYTSCDINVSLVFPIVCFGFKGLLTSHNTKH